jgi:hypothetical protein
MMINYFNESAILSANNFMNVFENVSHETYLISNCCIVAATKSDSYE